MIGDEAEDATNSTEAHDDDREQNGEHPLVLLDHVLPGLLCIR